jgi:hypothetical protein
MTDAWTNYFFLAKTEIKLLTLIKSKHQGIVEQPSTTSSAPDI